MTCCNASALLGSGPSECDERRESESQTDTDPALSTTFPADYKVSSARMAEADPVDGAWLL